MNVDRLQQCSVGSVGKAENSIKAPPGTFSCEHQLICAHIECLTHHGCHSYLGEETRFVDRRSAIRLTIRLAADPVVLAGERLCQVALEASIAPCPPVLHWRRRLSALFVLSLEASDELR